MVRSLHPRRNCCKQYCSTAVLYICTELGLPLADTIGEDTILYARGHCNNLPAAMVCKWLRWRHGRESACMMAGGTSRESFDLTAVVTGTWTTKLGGYSSGSQLRSTTAQSRGTPTTEGRSFASYNVEVIRIIRVRPEHSFELCAVTADESSSSFGVSLTEYAKVPFLDFLSTATTYSCTARDTKGTLP